MSRKRKLSDAEFEWKTEAADSFLSGHVSANKIQRLALKAQLAGAKGGESIAKAGKFGVNTNVRRDLTRHLRRGSLWPKFYYADIPVWDEQAEVMRLRSHPFLLPHEWLAKANHFCDFSGVMADVANHVDISAHIAKVATGLGSPASEFIPLGLHSDGVPYGSQIFYSDSLELFSLNLPCGTAGMRIPFTSVQKKHLVKHTTYNAVLEILAWSLKHLAFGTLPASRHDGAAFGEGEIFRLHSFGKQFKPVKALLVEVRADWVALKQVFQFPQQNENAGICWMCDATPSDIRDCKVSASWRQNRKTAIVFHLQQHIEGKTCPLWSAPGVNCSIVVVDWLHCADIGVTADVMGNILFELVNFFPGNDRAVRMVSLWAEICIEYDRQDVPKANRFHNLRLKSFKASGKSPKLKGKAAHIRYFVPVLDCIVQRVLLQQHDCHHKTVMACMSELAACYECLQLFDSVKLDKAARKMALLYCSLEKEAVEAGFEKLWKVKPKLHLFLELCHFLCLERQRGNPRCFWTYADETHGGEMRTMAKIRGGYNNSASSAYRLLSMWVSKNALLDLLK